MSVSPTPDGHGRTVPAATTIPQLDTKAPSIMSDSAVAVTGMGAVTPHGVGVDALWDGLLDGRQTAGPITRFDPSGHRVRFACEVRDDLSPWLPRKLIRQTDLFARFALIAAVEALTTSGLLSSAPDPQALRLPVLGVDPNRVGVVVGSGAGGITEVTDQHVRLLESGPDRVRPYLSIAMPANMATGQIAIRHGLRGPTTAVVSACASAADAIGMGMTMLRSARADVVVVGGAEAAINPVTMAGFAAAGAMSGRNDDPASASRPFDIDRDGFVAGEGAGVLVLETAAHARARGAPVLAWLRGYGATNDAHDPTQPAPGGEGAVRALRLALDDAGLDPADVDHVNAHGTSTPLNDVAESAALTLVLGGHRPPVTSTKSSIGHLMGAGGAVEAIATVRALQQQVIPATLNVDRQDPACPINLVVDGSRPTSMQVALSASFGFGGHNAVLVLATGDGR